MLIDCFMFGNELDILEGRLEYLYPVVNRFVIVESNRTHMGKVKPLYFQENIQRYKKYLDKILYFPVYMEEDQFDWKNEKKIFDYNTGAWKSENFQRNHIINALKFFNKDDIVMISDVDEIPHKYSIPKAIHYLNEHNPLIGFKQQMFFYGLDYMQVKDCYGTVICKNEEVLKLTPQYIREHRWHHQIPYMEVGGWHFSFWGTPKQIVNKLLNAPHQEVFKPQFATTEHVIDCMINGYDIYLREENPLQKVEREKIDTEIYNIFSKYENVIPEHFYQNVEGWFYPNDTMFYKQIINQFDSGKFVEVGSYKGRSSCFMAVEIARSGKDIRFDCIDTWEGSEEHQAGAYAEDSDVVNGTLYETFLKNIEPVKSYIKPIRMDSVSASKLYKDGSLEFVFIDAAHDYDNVKADINAWLPKIRKGGILGGHDHQIDGVRKAVEEILMPNGVNVLNGSCWWTIKK